MAKFKVGDIVIFKEHSGAGTPESMYGDECIVLEVSDMDYEPSLLVRSISRKIKYGCYARRFKLAEQQIYGKQSKLISFYREMEAQHVS